MANLAIRLKTILLVAIALSPATFCRADDPTPAQMLEKCQALQKAKLDGLKAELDRSQRALTQARHQKTTKDAMAGMVWSVTNGKKMLAEAEKNNDMPIPEMEQKLEVGAIGTWYRSPWVKVLQVLGPDKILAERGDRPVGGKTTRGGVEAVEHGSAEAMERIEEFKERRQAILQAIPLTTLIVEIPTTNITDDTKINLDKFGECWHVYKTTTYETAAGTTRTVLVAKPFDLTEVKKLWDEKQKN
jgi:hypothetical protein